MNIFEILYSGVCFVLDYVLYSRFRAVFWGMMFSSTTFMVLMIFVIGDFTTGEGSAEKTCYVDGYGEAVIVDGQIERYVIDDDCPYLKDS